MSNQPILTRMGAVDTTSLLDALNISLVQVSSVRTIATMPVDARTKQPFGLLHGGASVALAETLASLGAMMNIDRGAFQVVGIEINANHIRAKSDGKVTGIGTPIHVGRSTQVWGVEVRDEAGQVISIARCTLAVIPRS